MNRKIFLLTFAAFALSACSLYRVDSDETAMEFYQPKSRSAQIVYLETVNQPVEVIGKVSVNTERRVERPDIIEKIKREAALIGGDAITNIQEKPPVIKEALFKNGYIRTNYTADVLKFKGDAPIAAPTAAPAKP